MATAYDDTTEKARFEALRTLAFGGIGAAYATIGPIVTDDVELVRIINNTDKNLIFSIDGVTNQFILIAGTFLLLDLRTNYKKIGNRTQFWVKAEGALPGSGSAYIEVMI